MFSNNPEALATVARDRQCRLRADAQTYRLSRSVRAATNPNGGPRRRRPAADRRTHWATLPAPCTGEALS